MFGKLNLSKKHDKDDKKKALFSKGVDFVNWAINEGHDIVKMSFDKAYMQRVVAEYYKQKGDKNNDSCGENAG